MTAIERDNPALKEVLPKDYARPALDKQRLGQLIDMVGNIRVGDAEARSRDVLGRVYEYFLSQFASSEGKKGGELRIIVTRLTSMPSAFDTALADSPSSSSSWRRISPGCTGLVLCRPARSPCSRRHADRTASFFEHTAHRNQEGRMGPDPNTNTAINGSTPVGVGGWLLVYLYGSIPYLLFHSAGLSGWFSRLSPLAAGRDLPSPRLPARSHPPEVAASPAVERRRTVGRRPPDHAARGRRPFQSRDRRGGAEEEPRGMGGRDRDPRGHRGRVAGVGDDLDGLLPAIAPSTEQLPSAGG